MRVFICHSPDNRELAAEVAKMLEASGHSVIAPSPLGSALDDTAAIRTADAVVGIMSGSSPSLYYEVGLARGAHRPLVIAAHDLDELPADVTTTPFVSLTSDLFADSAAIGRRVDELTPASAGDLPQFDSNDQALRAIADEPELVTNLRPTEFEALVLTLLNDRGFTTEAPEDNSGLYDFGLLTADGDLIAIELKQYASANRVSVNSVLQLAGAVSAVHARSGLLVATSGFTRAALTLAAQVEVKLMTLTELLDAESERDLRPVPPDPEVDLRNLATRMRSGQDNVTREVVSRSLAANRGEEIVSIARNPASDSNVKRRQLAVLLVQHGAAALASEFDNLISNRAERRTVGVACIDRLAESSDDYPARDLVLKIYEGVRDPQRANLRDHAEERRVGIEWPEVAPNP